MNLFAAAADRATQAHHRQLELAALSTDFLLGRLHEELPAELRDEYLAVIQSRDVYMRPISVGFSIPRSEAEARAWQAEDLELDD